MKHTGIRLLAMAAALAVGLISQASAVTFTFLENGTGDLGSSTATFTESGLTLTAGGFGTPAANLWGKNDGPGETGLGLSVDAGGDNEIDKDHFVQFDSHLSPSGTTSSLILGSVQGAGEAAAVYGSNTWGIRGNLLPTGPLDGNDNVNLSGWLGTYRFFSVTTIGANADANVLLGSVSATVPDGGTTSLLLGLGLISLAIIRRKR